MTDRPAMCGLVLLSLALIAPAAGRAEVLSAAFLPAETIDLTKAGAIDWCVYRVADANAPTFVAADWKKGGAGIARKIGITGRVKKAEVTRWTGVGWGWADGTKLAAHSRRQGDAEAAGIRAWIDRGGALVFEFAAAPAGKQRQAHLIVRCDGKIDVVARQGDAARKVQSFTGGKHLGIAVVRYNDPLPVTIELVNPDRREQAVRGFAAALSGPADYNSGVPRLPTLQELADTKARELGEVDFLKAAVAFADCMIAHGRDRYGSVHSPLFAVLLTRGKRPTIGPQPYFARPSPYDTGNMKTPFRKYDFNRCLNYPAGLGGEGPHKVTLYGCDVCEDRALYEMLIDLSRITGDGRYKAEAHKALTWWFTRTLGPADLYPWGEHLGWDFENECPTYFAGPSKHLYAACYHEIKDRVPFLGFLAGLPAEKPGGPTYLERYALGVWKAHYWDRERAIYCRHGDYTGADDRAGSYAGFPAHQGAHLRLWVAAWRHARNAEVKAKMEAILNKVLDVQIARARKYGFVPFTFDPDYKGKDPGKQAPGQSIRLAHHAAELSVRVAKANPAMSAKLAELARLHLGPDGLKPAPSAPAKRPPATVADLSKADTPPRHAQEIVRRLEWHKAYQDAAFLKAAERQARLAYVRFMDATCPLPKAYSGPPRKTADGKPFPDFSFRGASLMHAFGLLGEALRQAANR